MMLRFLLDRLRLAGLVAVLGGAMVVVGQSVQFLDLLNLSLFGHDAEAPAQYARTLLLPLGELLVTLGLVGLYVRQAGEAGIVGLVGFVLLCWAWS
jgi:hypothetical protein